MSKLIMLRGLPASGKSTWAKQQVKDSKGKVKRVNKDELRAMIDAGEWSKTHEKTILVIRDKIINNCLDLGYDVIVDDTNFASFHEIGLKRMADKYKAEFEIKDFDTDVDECILRDAGRPNPVGKRVILDMYNRYVLPNRPKVEYVKGLEDIYICDIDGTIALHNGRSPYDESKVSTDLPNRSVVYTINQLAENNCIIFVSGRHETCREDTTEWLNKHFGFFTDENSLFMRKEFDNREDSIVKQELYEKNIKGKWNVLGVFDDRPRVCNKWRELGLTVFQVGDPRVDF